METPFVKMVTKFVIFYLFSWEGKLFKNGDTPEEKKFAHTGVFTYYFLDELAHLEDMSIRKL